MLIRGPADRCVLGTACSQVRWQLPPITSRSPWPTSYRIAGPPPRGRRASVPAVDDRHDRDHGVFGGPTTERVTVPGDAVATA